MEDGIDNAYCDRKSFKIIFFEISFHFDKNDYKKTILFPHILHDFKICY